MSLPQCRWKRSSWCCLALLASALTFVPSTASATVLASYSFARLTNNNPVSSSGGEAQLFMLLEDVAGQPGQVKFTFRNEGSWGMSITDIYFDLSTEFASFFGSVAGIVESSGVDYGIGASPANLTGANLAAVPFTANWSFDSEAPIKPNGVDPDEHVSIVMNLAAGQTTASTMLALSDGDLRMGIYVQDFEYGSNESFLMIPDGVPEPPVQALMLIGLSLLFGHRRLVRRR